MTAEMIAQVSAFRSGLAGGAPAGRVPSLPPDDQVELFRQQVDAIDDPTQDAASRVQAAGPDGAPAAHDAARPARHLGDAILSGLSKISAAIESRWTGVMDSTQLAQHGQLTASELVALQVNYLDFSVLYEIVGKGISRTTQNLDALTKMQ